MDLSNIQQWTSPPLYNGLIIFKGGHLKYLLLEEHFFPVSADPHLEWRQNKCGRNAFPESASI